MRRFARLFALTALCAATAAAAPKAPPASIPNDFEIEQMAVDKDVVLGGVHLACTGIGETRADPKWTDYPVRVEFSNARNEYMIDALVGLIDAKGEAVVVVRCDSPWLLLNPPPGTYSVYAHLMYSDARMRSARFTVPTKGQKRVVLQFPDS
jgi:hypothetical protein